MVDDAGMSDVLIVGAGPVGLTMALACQKQGLGFRLIDRLEKPSGLSKALALWSSALEMLDGLGVVGQFLGSGVSAKGVRISHGKKALAEIPAGFGVDSPYPQMMLLPQSQTERILTDALIARGETIERGVELVALEQTPDHVAVSLRHPDGKTESSNYRWVVGCDGAHSVVRHQIQVPFEGAALDDLFILCDAKVEGDIPEATALLFWGNDGLLAVFPVVRGVWRVIATRESPEDDRDPDLAEMQAILDKRGPGGWRLHDLSWLSKFRISERKAGSFRHGRVLLAGDAAHIHSPAGGQGMNTGMQDAFNLAWKLSLLARGKGEENAVLDSYHAERSPVAEQVLADSGRMIRSNFVRNRFVQIVRDRVVQVASHSDFVKRKMAGALSGLGIHYAPGTFVAADDTWAEDWRPHGYAPGWRPRDVVVFRSQEPVSLFSEWGPPRFTLVLFSGKKPIYRDVDRLASVALTAEGWGDLIKVVRVWSGDEAPDATWLVDPHGAAHTRFGADLSAFYLIRPDGYVALRSQPAEAGVLQDWLRSTLG